MINDIIISPLKILSDNRGKVMHMMRNDSKVFKSFGEVYFSTIYKDSIKAWHLHKEKIIKILKLVKKEKVKLVLFDDRKEKLNKWRISRNYFDMKKNYF